jgi:hypothetical protein
MYFPLEREKNDGHDSRERAGEVGQEGTREIYDMHMVL